MFSKSSDIYDAIYLPFKDYEAESDRIAQLIRQMRPGAQSVLDVACGTGEHAWHLEKKGFHVEGIDIEPAFVRLAQEKVPGARFTQADMTDFNLGRRFDVVLCLFSSIGYVQTVENLDRAIARMGAHVSPGGIVLVEPWFVPGFLKDRRTSIHTGEHNGFPVCRMGYTRIQERLSILSFQYLIGSPSGIEHRSEVHEMGLFTREEMKAAFTKAGLDVAFDENGLPMNRGLYIGTIS